MVGLKLKLLLVCALTLFVGAPVALGDWDPGDGHKMHFPQTPDPCGWDVYFGLALGDDWQCSETGPVEDIHFWISYYQGMGDPCGLYFGIDIFDNVPAGADPCKPWSHPGTVLKSWGFGPGMYSYRPVQTGLQGWLDPCSPWDADPCDHFGCWQINIDQLPDPCQFIQQAGEIYWLVISNVSEFDPCSYPGWKESLQHFEDDGVFWDPRGVPPSGPGWYPLTDPETGLTIDLAFVITGGEEPEPPKEPVPDLKWSQPPIEYDPTEPEPRFCGWDQVSLKWYDPCDPAGWWWMMAADDFRCFGSMPIDSIHWWGSHIGWDGDEPPDVTGLEPPIAAWQIGFWSNVPANPLNDPCYSHPDMLLWQIEVDAARVPVERVGIDEHPINPGFLETCFQYYVDLEPDEVFWQEDFLADTQDDIFWLSIAAIYPEQPDPFIPPDPCDPCGPQQMLEYPWGWKTRPWSWMDDGVAFDLFEDPVPGTLTDPCQMYPLFEYPGESYDLAFELDTDPNWIKWDQPYTGIRHWPHYEDIPSWMELHDVPYHLVVAADDWQCQGPLPVTALGWWGSYLGYQYQPCDPCFVSTRPEKPAYFDVSIWTDVPDTDPCDPATWSHPDEIVWQYDVYDYDEVLVGYDKYPHDPCFPIPGPHEPVFRYTARIPEEEWFWQDPNEDTVYWLSIVAVYEFHYPQYVWGWTNHQHVYNDDAVTANLDPAKQQWPWFPIYDQTGASADLSFTIYTDPYAEPPEPEIDFGDAPDPNYPTLLANNGARHIIGGPWFGDPCIVGDDFPDSETDGQPDPDALGDDNDGNDDEDGVSMSTMVQGLPSNMYFDISGADPCATVEFMIDFNGDGDWGDPGEKWHFVPALPNGSYFYPFPTPLDAVVGKTFTRWRIHSDPCLLYDTGLALDGEVEDHEVYIEGRDWGDAPDDPCTPMYPTLAANNGARHKLTAAGGPWFGPADDAPDPEGDGQPDADAMGDDNDAQGDDEDGVSMVNLTQGVSTGGTVFEVSGPGGGANVFAWIDYNGDGDWDDPGELIFSGFLLNGLQGLNITAPIGSTLGQTFARWRISSAGGLAPTGLADDGEVEDHEVYIEALDWGDAPDPNYPTLAVNNGARHRQTASGGPWLGDATDAPDAEPDGQPNATATGDDLAGATPDDEDGVVIPVLTEGVLGAVTVTVNGGGGQLDVWIDWNGDMDWDDAGEKVHGAAEVNGPVVINVTPPAGSAGTTFLRARINTGNPLPPEGPAPDGEVEDHEVTIEEAPEEEILKWSQPPIEIDPGPPPTYYGWDEYSIYGGMQIAGDDWLCEDYRPVSDIHWWGSYYGWDIPEPPQPAPIGFHIGIWIDVPAGVDAPWSHPGVMIWEYYATMAEVNEEPVGLDFHEQHLMDACFRYDLQIPQEAWFWQEGPGNIYWLTISAMYMEPPPPIFYWGWKTREHFFNDDAIRIWMPTAPMVGDPYMEGEPILPGWDLAFELTTQECMAPTHPDYATWTSLGYPACWCYATQCKGNVDGLWEITGTVAVFMGDLPTFLANFGVQFVTTVPGICANLDHLSEITGTVPVFMGDLPIFLANFGVQFINDCSGPGCDAPGCDPNPLPNSEFNFWR